LIVVLLHALVDKMQQSKLEIDYEFLNRYFEEKSKVTKLDSPLSIQRNAQPHPKIQKSSSRENNIFGSTWISSETNEVTSSDALRNQIPLLRHAVFVGSNSQQRVTATYDLTEKEKKLAGHYP